MTPGLGSSPASRHDPYNPQTKNVDEAPKRQGFSGFDPSRLGHIGDGLVRDTLKKKFAKASASAGEADKAAKIADRIPTGKKKAKAAAARRAAEDAARDLADLFENAAPSAGGFESEWEEFKARQEATEREALDREAFDKAELDREESGWQEWERHKPKAGPKVGPKEFTPPTIPEAEREPSRIAEFLPPELRPFLERMPAPRRREREEAILKKVGWDGLEILGLSPAALASKAEAQAREYAKQWPDRDSVGKPINMESEHRKGRVEKTWRRRLRKQQNQAVLYVESAIGAVGGPMAPGRPLYVSDYGLALHRQHKQRTEQILGDLWLIREDDPTVRIPMLEVDKRARAAKAAERRTLIDMMLYRWKMLGWYVCWITITLPGQYVCHSTNEDNRVTEWDPDLGPLEAMGAIQDDFHRVMNMLRARGIRPSGFWNAQPQQSGAPHRHILIAVPTVTDARAVCVAFRAEFGTRKTDEGPDRGCTASVIGDDDPRYRTRKGKSGEDETAASAAKYSARYSTRQETGKGDKGDEGNATGDGSEQERFEDWKRRRGARGHTWLGLDSQRAPVELWRTLWANAQRSDYQPDDTRMALAMTHIREVKRHTELAVGAREAAKAFPVGDDDRQAELDLAQAAADDAAREAWHASIALGMWPDADLDPIELAWLRGETEDGNVADPLPPMPLREARETVYGETRKAFVGAVGVVRRFTLSNRVAGKAELFATAKAIGFIDTLREKIREKRERTWRRVGLTATRRLFFIVAQEAGFGFSKRPDGTVAGFDCSGEILMKSEHDWLIVDTETAKKLVEESATPRATDEGKEGRENRWKTTERRNDLSDSPSDPRDGAAPHAHEGEGPPE